MEIRYRDFFDLMRDGGAELETEIGITSSLHRKKIVRAMKLRILGIAGVPNAPQNVQCVESIHADKRCEFSLTWSEPMNHGLPVHMYKVDIGDVVSTEKESMASAVRRLLFGAAATNRDEVVRSWTHLADVSKTFLSFSGSYRPSTVQVRVQAWNGVGHSEFSKPVTCTLSSRARATCNDANVNRTTSSPTTIWGQFRTLIYLFDVTQWLVQVLMAAIVVGYSVYYAKLYWTSNGVRVKSVVPLKHDGQGANARNERSMKYANRCNTCRKPFGVFVARKHYCKCCNRAFCSEHGKVACTVSCTIGGECVCQQCLGLIAVKREKSKASPRSRAKMRWGLLRQMTTTTTSNEPSPSMEHKEETRRHDDDDNNKERDDGHELVRLAVKSWWPRGSPLKRVVNPSALLNDDVHLHYDDLVKMYPDVTTRDWIVMKRVYRGGCIRKKLKGELIYTTRFIWVNVRHHRIPSVEENGDQASPLLDQHRRIWSLHWSKGSTRHARNKTISFGDIQRVENPSPCVVSLMCRPNIEIQLKLPSKADAETWYRALLVFLNLTRTDLRRC